MLNNQIDGWIRFITVVGYIVFVSMPAVCLSVYYVYIWDPQYLHKFPNEAAVNKSYTMHKTKEPRAPRELPEKRQSSPLLIQPIVPMNNQKQEECLCAKETIKSTIAQPSLANILSTTTTTVSSSKLASTTTNEIPSTTPNSPNSKSNPDYMSSSFFSSSSSSSEHLSSSSEFTSKSLEVN